MDLNVKAKTINLWGKKKRTIFVAWEWTEGSYITQDTESNNHERKIWWIDFVKI